MKAKTVSPERVAATRALTSLGPVIEGSLCAVRRGGQIRWQLTDRPAGKTRTLYVPAARAQEVRQWISNWKQAKEQLRILAEASREELRAADGPAVATPLPRRTATPSRQNCAP
jgi:hypothetical protein